MRYSSPRHWLEVIEYIALATSVLGLVFALVFHQNNYAIIPLIIALLLNFINRSQLEQKTQGKITASLNQIEREKDAMDQLIVQLKTAIASLTEANKQLSFNPEQLDDPQMLKAVMLELNKLQQRQQVLEKSMELLQTEIDLTTKQFKQRPELEQINNLTSVILDLQQFINQLPQWGNLQQQQLRELQEKVDGAVEQLSEEMAKIPQLVECEITRQRNLKK
jgi:predicted  nucleic acid-binding Zn-ribbon protein